MQVWSLSPRRWSGWCRHLASHGGFQFLFQISVDRQLFVRNLNRRCGRWRRSIACRCWCARITGRGSGCCCFDNRGNGNSLTGVNRRVQSRTAFALRDRVFDFFNPGAGCIHLIRQSQRERDGRTIFAMEGQLHFCAAIGSSHGFQFDHSFGGKSRGNWRPVA